MTIFPLSAVHLVLLFLLLGIPSVVALADILRSEFAGNNKLVWVVVVLSLPLAGAVLYFVIGREQKVPTPKNRH